MDHGLTKRSEKKGQKITAKTQAPAKPLKKETETPEEKREYEELGFIEDGRGLEECIDVAMSNHRPMQIALEEMKLSRMKVAEARRDLLPKPTIKSTETDGASNKVEFKERRYGLEVIQPLYYSGRLWNTYRQAKLNYEVSRRKFEKARADLAGKVAETYYALLSAFGSYKNQRKLYKEAEAIYAKSKRIFDAGLVTEIEFLNVQSQRDQVAYQAESARRDLGLARLKFQNALSIDPEESIELPSKFEFEQIAIDLDDAMGIAQSNRPELLIDVLMVKVNELERKIAAAKGGFKIDLTAFSGRSGARFVGEKLHWKPDRYLGLQVQRTLWGSTLNYTVTRDVTAPKLGQTSRTQTTAHNFEAGLWTNLQARSEVQAAEVGYQKAVNDLFEIQATIRVDVSEAYFNYEKALMQLKNVKSKIKLREKEVTVTTLQAGLGEAPLSQLIESKIKLVDEKVLWNQTLSNYYTAIANLNKAIGVVGYYGS